MAHLDAVGPDVVIVVAVVPGVGIAAHFGWFGAAVEASRRESICNLAERGLLVCEAVYMPLSNCQQNVPMRKILSIRSFADG